MLQELRGVCEDWSSENWERVVIGAVAAEMHRLQIIKDLRPCSAFWHSS